jgi:peptidylprolyl isomerase
VYDTWSAKAPFTFELGSGQYGSGWDEALTGAKAGGRRELNVPADEAFGNEGALFYVVEVLEVKPPSSKDVAGQAGGASRAR